MTTIYFIRHAQADNSVRDGRVRPLTEKGMADRALVTAFLQDKGIDVVLSSPFRRAVDTISGFAEQNNLEIEIVEDFRERKSDSDMASMNRAVFTGFIEQQWTDFSYTFSDGECLSVAQKRNIAALHDIIAKHKGKNIVIGTHGMALSLIIHYYDNTYAFKDFMAMVDLLPWAVKMEFIEEKCVRIEKIDLFKKAGEV